MYMVLFYFSHVFPSWDLSSSSRFTEQALNQGTIHKRRCPFFIFLTPLSPMSAFATFYPSAKFNEFWCLTHPFKLQTFVMDGPQLNSPCERATLLLSFVKFDMVTRNDRASFPWIVTIHFFLEKKRRVRYLRQSYLHQNIKREFKFPEKNVENDTLSLQKGCDKLSLKINMKRKYNCGSGKLISPWHFFFWYQIFYIVVTFSKEGIWFVVACCWLEHHS